MSDPLHCFGPATRAWFTEALGAPTPVQARGWAPITAGEHALLLAPTGSGKTLAAFLACLDRLAALPDDAPPGVRVVYVSPLKALAYDIDRNLRAPIAGIARVAARDGHATRPIRVAVRTGDTPSRDRRLQQRDPPDVLVTTPESLFLLLTSAARTGLEGVQTVIVDEIHAVASSKRGAHLALTLERLSKRVVDAGGVDPQRIGLSATQRPLERVASFLGGDRPVRVVDASDRPDLALQVVVPVPDLAHPVAAEAGGLRALDGVWPAIHAALLDLIEAHRSTIVFTNSRVLCERLAGALNEAWQARRAARGEALDAAVDLVKAHHGSIARHQREQIEGDLKAGRLPALVATASLELGIDMGAVDLVVQIGAPTSVASGLQRVGRAGHGVGQRSDGRIFPRHRGDLIQAAVVADAMLAGRIEETEVPRNALDVLAQQVVAMVALDDWRVDDLFAVVRRAFPYATLTRAALVAVLDMLSGRYPSDELADLRPRISWDRVADTLSARRGTQSVAVLNAGTIPDRGMFSIHVGADGPRIGEADEENVYERRRGQNIVLGASTWRIEEITRDRVIVSPAPGEPGLLPFWRGEGAGRPVALGREIGAFLRRLDGLDDAAARAWLRAHTPLDAWAADNLVAHLAAQRAATGALPTDEVVVIERYRDEVGDWRVVLHTPIGARVHAPWALALEEAITAATGFEVQSLWSDDGIVLRFADAAEPPDVLPLLGEPEDVRDRVVAQLRHSALFASRFRESAGRSLLLPRRGRDRRAPLWQQRLKAQNLLAAVSRYPSFPIVLETYRECLQDVFDLPALEALLAKIRTREVRVVQVETPYPSPFARSLVFAYTAAFLYELDAPLAERRAAALSLDRALLGELLGEASLRELLDPVAVADVEAALDERDPERAATDADALHDLLRRRGDASVEELAARAVADPTPWLVALAAAGRAVAVQVAGAARWIAAEDAARYRDALGVAVPADLPAVFLEAAPEPLLGLLTRFARTRGPFDADAPAARFGLTPGVVTPALDVLVARGVLVLDALRPGGTEPEYCHAEVLRRLRRASLARLRGEIEAVDAAVLGRFLPAWHGVTPDREGSLDAALARLEGLPVPASLLETELLPARVRDFHPRMLDQLGATGAIVWVGCGALGPRDGLVALMRPERVGLLVDAPPALDETPLHQAILAHLGARGASFLSGLHLACGSPPMEGLDAALWELVWSGRITNDTFLPLRALRGRSRKQVAASVGGRWSLVEVQAPRASDTARRAAHVEVLLARYGVVGREAVLSEGLAGGFAAIYPILAAMEEAGRARRGSFVRGLTGAQFAAPGVVDRLRAHRADGPIACVLSVIDPANPYGSLLPWPEVGEGVARPRRAPGARVVLVDGLPALFVEAGGRAITTLPAFAAPGVAARALAALVAASGGGSRAIRVHRIDGHAACASRWSDAFRAAGFTEDYKGFALEP